LLVAGEAYASKARASARPASLRILGPKGEARLPAAMAKAKKSKSSKTFPTELIVYVVKEGELRYFAAVRHHDEIPEEEDGEVVAIYALSKMRRFKIKRELT